MLSRGKSVLELDLVARLDVVIKNSRAAVMERLGLGPTQNCLGDIVRLG